ncbi:unnamed protein product [Bemisia tabaci]|uniref:Uncharacterized protein n=1 Tax=Bemisia tabaci TaxID=7038 RepID=A0A9P0A454_BEMTA|nr:unnamed protein product [Bemisia tabaci]
MRLASLILPLVGLLVLAFIQPGTSLGYLSKLRFYKGILMLGKDRCVNRCKCKHGYFQDSAGDYQLASVAKRGIVPGKCMCMVSRSLRMYITQKFGAEAAKRYGRLNFFGRTRQGREELKRLAGEGKGITFLTYEQFNQMVANQNQQKTNAQQRQQTGGTAQNIMPQITVDEVQADGSTKQVEVELTPEEIQRVQGFWGDVMERKRKEKAAQTAKAA